MIGWKRPRINIIKIVPTISAPSDMSKELFRFGILSAKYPTSGPVSMEMKAWIESTREVAVCVSDSFLYIYK